MPFYKADLDRLHDVKHRTFTINTQFVFLSGRGGHKVSLNGAAVSAKKAEVKCTRSSFNKSIGGLKVLHAFVCSLLLFKYMIPDNTELSSRYQRKTRPQKDCLLSQHISPKDVARSL